MDGLPRVKGIVNVSLSFRVPVDLPSLWPEHSNPDFNSMFQCVLSPAQRFSAILFVLLVFYIIPSTLIFYLFILSLVSQVKMQSKRKHER